MPYRSSVRILAIGAAAGVLTLLAQPVPAVLGIDDTLRHRAALMIQPALLTGLGLLLGSRLAPRLGLGLPLLDALVRREGIVQRLRAAAVPCLAVAGLAGLLIVGAGSAHGIDAPPLSVRVLYGGVTEEVIMRYGVMSVCVWCAARWLRLETACWTGLAVAALIFAAGHLPAVFAFQAGPTPLVLAVVLSGNALIGAGLGWLYWRHGLEAAIAAHVLAHLAAAAASIAAG